MAVYHVKPYRDGWFWHLAHFRFRTAFCALFGVARWHIPPRRCRIIDNFGLTFTITDDMLEMARGAAEAAKEQGLVPPPGLLS